MTVTSDTPKSRSQSVKYRANRSGVMDFLYDRPVFWKAFGLTLVVLIFTKIIPFGGALAMVACVVCSLFGPRLAIQALMINFLLLMASSAWMGSNKLGSFSELRWLVLLGAAFSVFRCQLGGRARRLESVKPILSLVLMFCVVEIVIGLWVSRYPTISAFKLSSFGVGAIAIPMAFNYSGVKVRYWQDWFGGWFAGCALAGVICLAWGGGFLKNGRGFEGAFDHPQTQGVVMGIAAAFFLGRYLFAVAGAKFEGVMGVLCLVAVYFSESRTGMFAAALSGGISVILLWLRHRERLASTRIFQHTLMALPVLVLGSMFLPGQVGLMMKEFIAKDEDSSAMGVVSAFAESRQELMDRSLENFRENPMLGIGFGAPNSEFTKIQTLFGIPLSASVEKGFIMTALLEEIGIVGTLGFCILLVTLVAFQLGYGRATLLWPMLAGFAMNFGEAMFFSIGGMGLLVWMMIGLGCMSDPASEC